MPILCYDVIFIVRIFVFIFDTNCYFTRQLFCSQAISQLHHHHQLKRCSGTKQLSGRGRAHICFVLFFYLLENVLTPGVQKTSYGASGTKHLSERGRMSWDESPKYVFYLAVIYYISPHTQTHPHFSSPLYLSWIQQRSCGSAVADLNNTAFLWIKIGQSNVIDINIITWFHKLTRFKRRTWTPRYMEVPTE